MSVIMQQRLSGLRRMGLVLIAISLLSSASMYLLSHPHAREWCNRVVFRDLTSLPSLTVGQAFPVYMLSALFIFLGLLCLGSVWQKRMFLR